MAQVVAKTLLIFTVVLIKTSTLSAFNTDCVVRLDSCEYELQLKPKGSNQGQCPNLNIWDASNSNIFQRVKRSRQSEESNHYGNGNNDDKESYKGATKFEKKILKSIDQLSIRMLRGVRRVERQVNDMMESLKLKDNKPKKCPTGFVTTDNWPSCYMFSAFDMSWYEAKDYCAAFDSDLVSLGTTREHFIVTYFIKNNAEYNSAAGWWTSGTFVTKTKQWMWTAQLFLKPFSFIKWAPSEPNEEAAQCMVIAGKDDHMWNDDLCTMRYNFVCEADARGL